MSEEPVYRCPHCDAVLDHVLVTEPVALVREDGYKRHPVNSSRRAQVLAAHRRGGVTAVMDELRISRAQAYRLIQQAERLSPNDGSGA